MKEFEFTPADNDPILNKLEDLKKDVDQVNECLIYLGYPPMVIKLSEFTDIRDYLAQATKQEVNTTAVYFDMDEKKIIK